MICTISKNADGSNLACIPQGILVGYDCNKYSTMTGTNNYGQPSKSSTVATRGQLEQNPYLATTAFQTHNCIVKCQNGMILYVFMKVLVAPLVDVDNSISASIKH